MAHPQIAAFARLANGGTPATRKIEGQKTLLGRTMHGIAYDEIHDEIVVPTPFAQSILTFRGAAQGEEPPIRVLQGPLTGLRYPDKVAIDPVHNEIFVPEYPGAPGAVFVFSREASGDVAPIRVLQGPDALRTAAYVTVDPVNNLLLVTGISAAGEEGVLIFDRTAQGNTKPLRVIHGPRTQITGDSKIVAYPPRGYFLTGARIGGGSAVLGGRDPEAGKSFVGVWSIHDNGDVPPRWMIGGGVLYDIFGGMTLDPKHKTVIMGDKRSNAIFTYSFPEIF